MSRRRGVDLRPHLIAGLAFSLLVAALATAALAAPTVIGIAAAVINDVQIKPSASPRFGKAKLRQKVALADRVRTGVRSHLQLILLDRAAITVGSNAELTIDRFIYDPSEGSVTVSVAKGAFRFLSGKSKRRSVTTPAATIGIRGTVFDGAVGLPAVEVAKRERATSSSLCDDQATATLTVLRGPGPNTSSRLTPGAIDVTAAGKTVALDKPLQAAFIPCAGAAPIGPFQLSSPGLARLNSFLLPPVGNNGQDSPGEPSAPAPSSEPSNTAQRAVGSSTCSEPIRAGLWRIDVAVMTTQGTPTPGLGGGMGRVQVRSVDCGERIVVSGFPGIGTINFALCREGASNCEAGSYFANPMPSMFDPGIFWNLRVSSPENMASETGANARGVAMRQNHRWTFVR